MSLMEEPGLNKMHAALNVSERAHTHLQKLHQQWELQTGTLQNNTGHTNTSNIQTDQQSLILPSASGGEYNTAGQIDNKQTTVNCDNVNSRTKSVSTTQNEQDQIAELLSAKTERLTTSCTVQVPQLKV